MGRVGIRGGGGDPWVRESPEWECPAADRERLAGMSRPQGELAALTLYPRTAVYKLDGSESVAQLGGPMQSAATLKADRAVRR
jgi:hypothetical protein